MGSQLQQNQDDARQEEWQFSFLAAFESGELYDCTFRVGCDLKDPSLSFKDFKCHKLILSACSPMFGTMFLGQFKEAKLGPDEPILIDKVDPLIFESAMRFVYGQDDEFEDTAFGMKLYQFAHEMQIESLLDELVEFLKTTEASEIFALFDLYIKTNNQVGIKYCKLILEVHTKAALESEDWLNCSSDSCLEFLKMERLNIGEASLVKALVKWGEFQMVKVAEDKKENLRSKILPGLRQIRFDSLTLLEAVDLCNSELEKVLTGDEKYSLMSSISTGEWEMMPAGIVSASKPAPRFGPFVFFPLPYNRSNSTKGLTNQFTFTINKQATIVGVKFKSTSLYQNTLANITLYEGNRCLGTGDLKSTCLYREEVIIKIKGVQSLCLDAERDYTLKFDFARDWRFGFRSYSLPASKIPSTSDDFVLHINESTINICMHLQGILFEKEKSV